MEPEIIQEEKKRAPNHFADNIKCAYKSFDFILIDLDTIFKLSIKNNLLQDFTVFLRSISVNFPKMEIITIYPNITDDAKLITLESISNITELLSLSDLCVFEKKEALALFNLLNQLNSDDEVSEDLTKVDDKYLDIIFMNAFRKTKKSFNKRGIFIDELNKLTIVEVLPNNTKVKYFNSYEFQLYPKINHKNYKLIDEYKKCIAINYKLLKSVFLGCFLYQYMQKQSYYTDFISGEQIARRMLEALKNNWTIPKDNSFYQVVIDKNMVDEQVRREILQKREEEFVLDCVNVNQSKLKFYNPLYDTHLSYYFSSSITKKNLKEAGFINTKGFILSRPRFRSPEQSNKMYQFEEKMMNSFRDSYEKQRKRSLDNSRSKRGRSKENSEERKLPTMHEKSIYFIKY
jgi:hypothetical protein